MDVPAADSLSEISVQELAALLSGKSNVTLLDVRETAERQIVHLPESELLDEAKADELLKRGDREAPLYFICHHGIRSLSAAQFFAGQGFKEVYSVAGGIDAWAREIDPEMTTY